MLAKTFQRRGADQKSENLIAKGSSRRHRAIFVLLITFLFFLESAICQRIDGQFFTPGLLIINTPTPNSTRQSGKEIAFSLELCGDGLLPPSNTDQNSQLATAILNVSIFLVNRQLNLTVKDDPQLLQGQRGSCVKKFESVVPKCAPPGDYQLVFHELDRINGKEFYSIYSLPFHVQSGEETPDEEDADDSDSIDAECSDQPSPKSELKDFRSSEQTFIRKGVTGFALHKDKMPVPEKSDIHVPEVKVTTLIVEDSRKPAPPLPNPVRAPSSENNSAASLKPSPSGNNQNQNTDQPTPQTRTELRPLPSTNNDVKSGYSPISVVGLKSSFHNNTRVGVQTSREKQASENLKDEEFLFSQVASNADPELRELNPLSSNLNSADLSSPQSKQISGNVGAFVRKDTTFKATDQFFFSVPLIASSGANASATWTLRSIAFIYAPFALFLFKMQGMK